MPEQTAIAVMNDYPADKFNLLIPIKTLQELSPLHKVVINQVQINPEVNKKEVYKEKNGELALTKKGLAKLMTAANIQMVESKPVMPQKCLRCTEMAEKTKLAPKCYECPYCDDVAYQVTLAVPEPSGTWRKVVATKELRMADARESMKDAQFKSFFPFRTEQCETKALNRALREALMINATYKTDELRKPFAVAYVVPNMDDPDLKKVMVSKYAESSAMLFGGSKEIKTIEAPGNIPEDKTTIINANEEDENNTPVVEAEIVEDKKPVDDNNPADIACEKCGQIIEAIDEQWTVEAIVEYSKKKFRGKILCADCQHEALEAAKARKAGSK